MSLLSLQNNVYGDPAWTLDSERNAYYYHSHLASEPDLNLRNEDVRKELKVCKGWHGDHNQ